MPNRLRISEEISPRRPRTIPALRTAAALLLVLGVISSPVIGRAAPQPAASARPAAAKAARKTSPGTKKAAAPAGSKVKKPVSGSIAKKAPATAKKAPVTPRKAPASAPKATAKGVQPPTSPPTGTTTGKKAAPKLATSGKPKKPAASGSAVTRRPIAPVPASALAADSELLRHATDLLGRPYRFGGNAGSFDCSGFVREVFSRSGFDLPRSARDQFRIGDKVGSDELSPGDLVFFRTYRRDASHVGIYLGENQFIHAATRGGRVQIDSLRQDYYSTRYLGARRIAPAS